MPSWFIRVRTLFRRSRMERELDAELAFHLDMLTAQYIKQGMSPDRARSTARQLFGGVEHVKDDVRDTWLTRVVETIVQDARYGFRGLRSNLGYAAAVIATMALGIGANSAIFSVVNAVVLQPLPYARGEDLVVLRQVRTGADNLGFSIKDIDDIKAFSGTLDAVVEYHSMYFILLGGEEPARVATGVVSWDYFQALGVKPVLGRTFRAEDDAHDGPAALILSHDYWRSAFDSDPTVIGRVFRMNDRLHTVIGVLPDVPMYPEPNDVYMPRSACPFRMAEAAHNRRGSGMTRALGRLKPATAAGELEADLASVATRLQELDPSAYPAARGHGIAATPLRREFTRNFETTLGILLSTAGFVLLIVVASVANLAVARAMRRDHELAVRTTLGATRGRLLCQLITESLILSIAGGAAGLVLAFLSIDLLVGYVERFTPRATEIRVDTTVLLFTLTISLVTAIASGAVPALARRVGSRSAAIYARGRAAVSRRDLRRLLIVAQVAAAFVLLIGAGLMLRSLLKLSSVDPGFTTDHLLTMQIDMNFTKYAEAPARAEYLARLEASLQAVPGVMHAGAVGSIPFSEYAGFGWEPLVVEGAEGVNEDTAPRASLMIASDDYFRAMNIPLVDGRFFNTEDRLGAPDVVIINRSLADRLWPEESPIGRRIAPLGSRRWRTIVGVVADVRQQLAREPRAEVYAPMAQAPYVSTSWAIRSTIAPEELIPLVRGAIRAVDPDQPIHRLRTLDDVRSASLAPPRLTTTLLTLFAALALFITATGIGAVIAYSVSQRTREFGVRFALGATRGEVLSMVLGEGVKLTLIGLGLGVLGALVLSSLLSTMLFGVEPTDAVTYVAVSSVLLAVAALACLLPAVRAASINPLQVLN